MHLLISRRVSMSMDANIHPTENTFITMASHTGKMHIWRMKPDGSGREEMTDDEYNDWFPHISPDGKWIVFISFPADIEPNTHPSYKRVMLRLMPAKGENQKLLPISTADREPLMFHPGRPTAGRLLLSAIRGNNHKSIIKISDFTLY